jgi:MoaA/NifB/PqqE/SkfB family radical SAM enzyme
MLTASLAFKALRTRFIDARPFILSHLITARCNADCATCLWKMPANACVDEMRLDEIVAIYREAAASGFQALVLWGGEPLVRQDTPQALMAARDAGLNTTLITNGWWLADKADELLPAVNRLMVSVDGLGYRHDEIRRLPGLFERLDRGLSVVKRDYPDVVVIVNAVLSRLNIDQLEELAAYGSDMGTHVAFQAMNVTDYGFAERNIDLAKVQLTPAEEGHAAHRIRALQRKGYPVRDSNSYLSRLGPDAQRYHCHFKKVCLRLEPNGDVLDCTGDAVPMTNLTGDSLGDFTTSGPFREFLCRAEQCNRCRDAAVVEVSHMWDGKVGALWNAVRSLA